MRFNAKNNNLNLIIMALSEVPDGLWIREIAKRTGLKPMTVSYHVSHNPELFEEQVVEGPKKPLFRLVKLRKGALAKPSIMLSKILKELHETG